MTAARASSAGAQDGLAHRRQPIDFADLGGWADDAHDEAFAALALSLRAALVDPDGPAPGLRPIAEATARLGFLGGPRPDRAQARAFFENHFRPVRIPTDEGGFLTGYYEPEVDGSSVKTERFRFPLHRRPPDLVDVDATDMPPGWDPGRRFARKTASGLEPYFDRAAIEAGALEGQGLELVYLDDPVDVFIIHVQGSARIRLAEGGLLRVSYVAKAGHPYTSLGKLLIERGIATAETMTLAFLTNWLRTADEAGRALMRENRSYIFFQELDDRGLDPALGAVAAAGVQLTPGRSIAVDPRHVGYGLPVWIEARLPVGQGGSPVPFRRLMIAQDTGSAIVGPARADLFVGLGAEAGEVAGRIRHRPDAFIIFEPVAGARP